MPLPVAFKSSEGYFYGKLHRPLFQMRVYEILHARIEFKDFKAVSHLKTWQDVCHMFQPSSVLILFDPDFHGLPRLDLLNIVSYKKITGFLLLFEFHEATEDI